jgi:MFS family permease
MVIAFENSFHQPPSVTDPSSICCIAAGAEATAAPLWHRSAMGSGERPPDGPAGLFAGLTRNVVVLSWVSFFQDAASEMLYPVLPLFLTGVLGAPASIVGLIEGVAEGTASVMKAVSGRLADIRRRRPLVATGYGISSLSKLVIGFATGWPLVLVARFADRFGKGLRTSPRDALIAADTPPEHRGRAFGFNRALDTAGAVVGPLAGLALYEALDHRLRPLFFVAFVPAAASVALIGLVREHGAPPDRGSTPQPRGPLPRRYWRVVLFLTLFGLANFSDALLILRAKALGLSFVGIILVYALYNVSYAFLSYPAGVISDRVPRRLVFATGLAIFAVAYIGLGTVSSAGWVWFLLPLYGGYTALTDGVGKAWVADLLPETRVGSGLGLYQGLAGGAALIAGVWAGLAWGAGGRAPLLVSGVVVAGLAVALFLRGARLEQNEAGERARGPQAGS